MPPKRKLKEKDFVFLAAPLGQRIQAGLWQRPEKSNNDLWQVPKKLEGICLSGPTESILACGKGIKNLKLTSGRGQNPKKSKLLCDRGLVNWKTPAYLDLKNF